MNFWETPIGQDIDKYNKQITNWMYAMLVTTGLTAVAVIVMIFKKSK